MTKPPSVKTRPVGILGLGKYLPPKVMTNQEMEKFVATTDEWIRSRTGIRERRVAEPGTGTSHMAAEASRQALARSGITPDQLDLIIVATVTPDMPFPSTACVLQAKLGADKAACFDLGAACAGFVFGLVTAQQYIATGMYRYALVVGADMLSSLVDWNDRSTCVLFGDGAGAAVVGPASGDHGIRTVLMGSDGKFADDLKVPAGGSLMPASHATVDQRLHAVKMNGNEVFKFAVRTFDECVKVLVEKSGLTMDQVDCVIPHQANLRIINAATERLGIPPQKVKINLDKYGNMSAGSTVVALCEAEEEGMIYPGANVITVAFGSGFVWAGCYIKW